MLPPAAALVCPPRHRRRSGLLSFPVSRGARAMLEHRALEPIGCGDLERAREQLDEFIAGALAEARETGS